MKRLPSYVLCSFFSLASTLNAEDVSLPPLPQFDSATISILTDTNLENLSNEELSINEIDVVQERIADVKVERHVALDSEGNFVNHGAYTHRDRSGNVLLTGQYQMGVRTGVWTKNLADRNSALLKVYPYSKARLPLKATVEFVDGKMHGSWSIEDADHRVLSQIDFSHGVRSGKSVWLHPSGGVYRHCEYSNGRLDGPYVELDMKGKTVREFAFVNGQRTSNDTEYYSNHTKKAEYAVLVKMVSQTQDDFDSFSLLDPKASKESIRHGLFTSYYPNGKVQMRGSYDHGKLKGLSESWHENGQRESIGEYADGVPAGKWSWWHSNGMRRANAVFRAGQVEGEMLSWDEFGNKTSRLQMAKEQNGSLLSR